MLAKRSLGDGHAAVPGQRRRGPDQASTSEWGGGEGYGPGNDVYYHVVGGQVTGTRPGDSVKVWFAGGGERATRSPTASVRQRAPGADRRGGGLHRRLAGPARQRGPHYLVVLRGRAGRQRRRVRRLRRRRQRPDGAGQPRRAEPLRRGRLVHGRRRRDARAGLGPGQRVAAGDAGAARGARLRQRGRPRALHGPARRPAVHAGVSARSSTTRSRTGSAAPTRPCWRAAWRCPGRATRQGDPIEYMFGAAITTPDGGIDPDTGDPFDVAGIDDPLDRPDVGVQRPRQRPEPGQRTRRSSPRATSSR